MRGKDEEDDVGGGAACQTRRSMRCVTMLVRWWKGSGVFDKLPGRQGSIPEAKELYDGESLSVRQGQNGKRNRYMQRPNLVCATSSCQTKPPLTLPEGNPAWVHSSSAMAAAQHRQRRAASTVVLSRCILIHCGGRHTISFRPAFETLHDASRQARCVAGDSCTATSWGGRGL